MEAYGSRKEINITVLLQKAGEKIDLAPFRFAAAVSVAEYNRFTGYLTSNEGLLAGGKTCDGQVQGAGQLVLVPIQVGSELEGGTTTWLRGLGPDCRDVVVGGSGGGACAGGGWEQKFEATHLVSLLTPPGKLDLWALTIDLAAWSSSCCQVEMMLNKSIMKGQQQDSDEDENHHY